MACEILTNRDDERSVFICNTSDVAFGPVFSCSSEAETFMEWLTEDPRSYPLDKLMAFHCDFRNCHHECSNCGTWGKFAESGKCEGCLEYEHDARLPS